MELASSFTLFVSINQTTCSLLAELQILVLKLMTNFNNTNTMPRVINQLKFSISFCALQLKLYDDDRFSDDDFSKENEKT
jgi:hypothetical protein